MFYFNSNFLIFLIDHFVEFSISYKLKILFLNIWELIFDKRRGLRPLLLLKMLRWSELIFYGTMTGTIFNSLLVEFLLLNRRMPNCTTVLQTASDLYEPEIRLNSPKNYTFRPFIRLKILPKSFGIVQLMHERVQCG